MRILLEEKVILARLDELAAAITAHYRGRPLTALALLNGALFFAGDLLRRIPLPLLIDTVAVSSYRHEASSGKLTLRSAPKLPVAGREILLLDEILDTGLTLRGVRDYLLEQGAAEVRSCVLLDKACRRAPGGLAHADWCGFEIPDVYVVGYGLDADEQHRNHPFVGVLD